MVDSVGASVTNRLMKEADVFFHRLLYSSRINLRGKKRRWREAIYMVKLTSPPPHPPPCTLHLFFFSHFPRFSSCLARSLTGWDGMGWYEKGQGGWVMGCIVNSSPPLPLLSHPTSSSHLIFLSFLLISPLLFSSFWSFYLQLYSFLPLSVFPVSLSASFSSSCPGRWEVLQRGRT